MSLLVVGSTAFDTIETPHGKAERCLGGSSTYFGLAARLFTPVRLVSVVGEDFPAESRSMLADRGVCLDGLEEKAGKTFAWHGRYSADMNSRETIDVQLNTFGDFEPKVPAHYRETPFVFLANGSPKTQLSVVEQMTSPKFVVADTMDLWIDIEKDGLLQLLQRIDGIILNDSEVQQLTGESNLIAAGEATLALGPKLVIVKKGEHGCFVFGQGFRYALPAYPTTAVVDPTGAGDSFAGGFMGFLAQTGDVTAASMKRAVAYGTVTASFNVEGFGVDRLAGTDMETVERRLAQLMQLVDPS